MGVRTHNLLYREGVRTVAQLRALPDERLWNMRLMGKAGMDLIHTLLEKDAEMADETTPLQRKLLDAIQNDRDCVLDPRNPGYIVVLGEDLGPEHAAITLNLLTMVPGVVAVTPIAANLRTIAVEEVVRQQIRARLQAMLKTVGG